MRIVTVVGTRPEIIRLSRIIFTLDNNFDHILVHTGQNWSEYLNNIFFDELGIRKPDYNLEIASGNLGIDMGRIISESYKLFQSIKPDALLILGDTNSALCSISAKRLKIPIFHMEAGNRCFDQCVPEEINRKIIDHISDVNLPYTEHSRRYLISEGIKQEYTIVTGSPLTEVIMFYKSNIDSSDILNKLLLTKNEYFVVSLHREENVDNEMNFNHLVESINEICTHYKYPVIFSTHPRTRKKLKDNMFHPLVNNIDPLGFFDYCHLQQNAYCVISDSGTISEESTILGFKAIIIRTSTERPEVFDTGNIIIGNINKQSVLESIKLAIKLPLGDIPTNYQPSNVSVKIAKIIQSFVPIINKNIWKK